MDLPCAQWQDHVAQKWAGLETDLKEHFTSLREIDDVFKCALTLTSQDDLDFLQSVSAGYSVQKDSVQASKCRERGNSSFKTRNYTAAALHYSQGICFAPQSSEQLSLCYANRSAALHHLQRYQVTLTTLSWQCIRYTSLLQQSCNRSDCLTECLDDIAKARKNGYPSHLLHKLEGRRTECLKQLARGQKEKEDHHNLASENFKRPHQVKAPSAENLTCGICPQATVSLSLEKGRHLVAAERIAAGEVILHDRPYSCVLIPGTEEVRGDRGELDTKGVFRTEHQFCHRCLTETLCPVPCEGCSYSRYCSTSCQWDAWGEHHRWECPLGADLMALGVLLQLALRVTLQAGMKNVQMAREPIRDQHRESEGSCLNRKCRPCHTNQPEPSTAYCGDSYLSVFHLLHHLNDHSPALRFLNAITVATLYLRLCKAGPLPASWTLSGPSDVNGHAPGEEGGNTDWSSELWLLGSAVLRHILQLRCNAQAILMLQDTGPKNSPVQSSRETRIATAIFPTLSLLNHSCCPNTSLAFSTALDLSADCNASVAEHKSSACGVAVTVRAAKGITAGQEILHCYGPHSSRMVIKERQRLLQEQYFFLCQCEACTLTQEEEEGAGGRRHRTGVGSSQRESGLLCGKCKSSVKKNGKDGGFTCLPSCGHCVSSSEVNHRLQGIRADLEKAVKLIEREKPGEALSLLKRTQCQSRLILAETHPVQGELADAMARAYATMGDWNNAASHLEQSTIAICSQYGEDSIELGQQLFKLAQLHFNGGARHLALSVIPKVRRLLCLHRGPHCNELQELQAMEDCLQG